MNNIKHYINADNIRLIVVELSEIMKKVQTLHKITDFSATLLSKMFLNTALLAIDFKNKESISLQWHTNSPLGTVSVDVYNGNYIRGYIEHPQNKLNKINESNFLKKYNSFLSVIRYSLLKHPFKSVIQPNLNSIDEIFTEFSTKSDQIDSKFLTKVEINSNGYIKKTYGILIQLLPNGNKQKFKNLFNKNNELTEEKIKKLIINEKFIKIFETELEYKCTCFKEKFLLSLNSLPTSEKEELLKKEYVNITCNCCGKEYNFNKKELLNFIKMEN